jgi:protein ImuB
MLWIAIRLAQLPLEAFLRGSPLSEPFAVADGHRIVACDKKASARGVSPGMACPAATALAPQLRIRQRDGAAETEALLGFAAWSMQFTPNVALEFPDTVLLEISGSLKLYGGPEAIVRELREGLAAMGFSASIAGAPTPRAACWLAHAGKDVLLSGIAQIVEAISTLPVTVLHCNPEVHEALHAIGAATHGDLLALPREGLARRFGQTLLDDLDRALGRLPDPRTFYTPPAAFLATIELPAEVTQAEALLFAARRLLAQLGGFLAARSGGVQRFALRLAHRDGGVTEIAIGLVAASRDIGHFTLLVRERLNRLALREPVRAVAIEAGNVLALAGDNLHLFPDEAGVPGNWIRLIERLRARLGTKAVHGIKLQADHRPERAAAAVEQNGKQLELQFGERPFWLLDSPRPIPEVGAVPHYDGPLELLAGPERIESGWWDDDDIARDYFVARTKAQSLVWIYRERGYQANWYLHGLFA